MIYVRLILDSNDASHVVINIMLDVLIIRKIACAVGLFRSKWLLVSIIFFDEIIPGLWRTFAINAKLIANGWLHNEMHNTYRSAQIFRGQALSMENQWFLEDRKI